MFASFSAVYHEVRHMGERGEDRSARRALLERHIEAFPRHRGLIFQLVAELYAEDGQSEAALDTLARSLAAGSRYRAEWLSKDPRLASLAEMPRFAQIVARAQAAYDEASAAAKPHLMFAMPDTLPDAFGYPLLMVLHGNNSNAKETAPLWSAMADKGWVVAVPQSSEVGASPDAFVWNDRARTAAELDIHFDKVKKATQIDSGRIVLAGFSMGATQALALALTKRFTVRGVVPIAAYLAAIDEFTGILDGGAAKMLRAYVVVGSEDTSVAGARGLVNVMTRNKLRATLDERPGLGHDYPPDMDATLAKALEFATK